MNTSTTQLVHALLFTSGETWRFSELAETLKISNRIGLAWKSVRIRTSRP